MAERRDSATNETKRNLIFVTGYFGAPIKEEAQRIASCKGWPVLDLDAAIEEKDGRSIARICMMGGEHAYRNAEYELVEAICRKEQTEPAEQGDKINETMQNGGLVVACGDGILYDDDSRAQILQHYLVIAGQDWSIDELWEGALKEESTYHAFMKFGTADEKRAKFEEHHNRQQHLFAQAK